MNYKWTINKDSDESRVDKPYDRFNAMLNQVLGIRILRDNYQDQIVR